MPPPSHSFNKCPLYHVSVITVGSLGTLLCFSQDLGDRWLPGALSTEGGCQEDADDLNEDIPQTKQDSPSKLSQSLERSNPNK